MKITSINLFYPIYLSIVLTLGFMGLVSWWVILIVVLGQLEIEIKR